MSGDERVRVDLGARSYDVVVGNPPYQAISKTAGLDYVVKKYALGKANLYEAFLERGLELVGDGGLSALLTMRGWMFLGKGELLKGRLLSYDALTMTFKQYKVRRDPKCAVCGDQPTIKAPSDLEWSCHFDPRPEAVTTA